MWTFSDGLLALFEHRIEAAQHRHGERDVSVLAGRVEVAQHVVGDPQNSVGYPADVAAGRSHALLVSRRWRRCVASGASKRRTGLWAGTPPCLLQRGSELHALRADMRSDAVPDVGVTQCFAREHGDTGSDRIACRTSEESCDTS